MSLALQFCATNKLEGRFAGFCWVQHAHIIVLLTHKNEGSTVKCWAEGIHVSLHLRALEMNDYPGHELRGKESETSGGLFRSQTEFQVRPKPKFRNEVVHPAIEDNLCTIKWVNQLTNNSLPPCPPPRHGTQSRCINYLIRHAHTQHTICRTPQQGRARSC